MEGRQVTHFGKRGNGELTKRRTFREFCSSKLKQSESGPFTQRRHLPTIMSVIFLIAAKLNFQAINPNILVTHLKFNRA